MFGSKGKIQIQLQKYNYKPGEYIQGTVNLELKKDVNAEEFTVRLIGDQLVSRGFGTNRSRYWQRIYDFSQPLGGQGEYKAQPMVVPFRILIPANVMEQKKMNVGGTLGKVLDVAQSFGGMSRRTKWSLVARLKIPGWFNDISKKIQVNIG